MKKKKNIHKINVKIIPSTLRHLNITNNNTIKSSLNNIHVNKSSNKAQIEISNKNKIKSNSVKIKNNLYKYNQTPKRLNTINLIDKKIDIIYDWNILVNNKSPGIYYKKEDYKKLSINNFETESNIPKNSIILLDLPDKQIKNFFGKKSLLQTDNHPKTAKLRNFSSKLAKNLKFNAINKNISSKDKTKKDSSSKNNDSILNSLDSYIDNNHIHPKSIYTPREPHQPFYYSDVYNDYYKHDIKYFAKMLPSLGAKIKTSNKRLMKEIINLKYKTKNDSYNLKQFFENDDKIFKVQDLIIAGIRNNPVRLMNNLYKLKHPNFKKVKQDMKMYFKTMKPIGEYFGEIDFTKNERWRTYKEIKKLRNMAKKGKRFYTLDNKEDDTNLILSYYKVTDPHIKYFSKLVKKYYNSPKSMNDNNEFYKTIFSNEKKKNKMTETEDESNFDFFRDKLFKNTNNKKNKIQIGNKYKENYNNYFMTETTKNSNNEVN